MDKQDHLFTVEEVARMLRISDSTVRSRLASRPEDLPPSIAIGRRRLFPSSAFTHWLQQRVDKSSGPDRKNVGPEPRPGRKRRV